MKLATERTASPDGRLLVVSRDLSRAAPATGIARTLQEALERWDVVVGALEALYGQLNEGVGVLAIPLRFATLAAPLPRAWQWLDGSAFPSHGELMQKAFDLKPIETTRPLMYQGLSHQFLGPTEDVPLPSEADGIDFECELAIITGSVPMAIRSEAALGHVRLVGLLNDWSLRTIAPIEMKTGFGWIQAKPACSMAPIVVTPDELGPHWNQGRLQAKVEVWRNEELYGAVPTTGMEFGFHELIAHAAGTRALCAGTIIGSGTVSSRAYRTTGSCCIAERRAIEMIDHGLAQTPYLRFGERVRMWAHIDGATEPPFGVIDQHIVSARSKT